MIETRRPSRIAPDYSLRMSWKPEVDEIERRRELARAAGRRRGRRQQHARGRLTVRERIDALVDPGSFRSTAARGPGGARREQGALRAFTPANVVVGIARIDGRPVVIGGDDFTIRGGAYSAGGSSQGPVRRRARDPAADPAGAPARGRRRVGGGRLRRARPLGLRPHRVLAAEPAVHGGARHGARGLRRARPGGGLPRGAAGGLALLADDARDRAGAHGRAGPRGARARQEASTKKELGGAEVHLRSGVVRQRRRGRGRRLPPDPRLPRLPAGERWEAPPVLDVRTTRPSARRRSCSRSSRASGGAPTRSGA